MQILFDFLLTACMMLPLIDFDAALIFLLKYSMMKLPLIKYNKIRRCTQSKQS